MTEIKSTYRWLAEADRLVEELKSEDLTEAEKSLLQERLSFCLTKAVEGSFL